jgi:hypothetical protein
MIYTKPEINLLGKATRVIQIFDKCVQHYVEAGPPFSGDPAYDLDE